MRHLAKSLVQAFKVPELRNKILFTLGILALYRLGAYIPVPGIPFHAFADAFSEQGVGMAMLDLFTGGALSNFSVFALGIMPYITASIIMQLMQGVIPAVGRWAREGETEGAVSLRSRVISRLVLVLSMRSATCCCSSRHRTASYSALRCLAS